MITRNFILCLTRLIVLCLKVYQILLIIKVLKSKLTEVLLPLHKISSLLLVYDFFFFAHTVWHVELHQAKSEPVPPAVEV